MESNKLDTFFKNKIDMHDEPVSKNAWSSVQSGLKAKKKTKKPLIWYVAASISILLVSVLGTYNYFNSEDLNVTVIAKIDLNRDQIALEEHSNNQLSTPIVARNKVVVKKENKNLSLRYVTTVAGQKTSLNNNKVQRSTADLPRLTSIPITVNKENSLAKVTSFKRIESDIMVNINYVAQEKDKLNEFKQTTNKIKSLASELNLADLRSAKNELFASALTFDKKQTN